MGGRPRDRPRGARHRLRGLALTVLAPADRDGAEVVGLTVQARNVGYESVQVVVPAGDNGGSRGGRCWSSCTAGAAATRTRT